MSDAIQFDYAKLPDGSYAKFKKGTPPEQMRQTLMQKGLLKPKTAAQPEQPLSRMTSISAVHPKGGLAGVSDWLEGVRNKLRESAASGVGERTGDFMASAPLGLLKAAKGVSEIPQKGKTWQGAKDIVSGGLQASEMPASFMGPETGTVVKSILPSTERAGKMLEQVEKIAGHLPIDANGPGRIALRIQSFAESGATMPQVVRKFLARVTAPDRTPLTFSEARKFYENATRLSADEAGRLTPRMKHEVGEFTKALDDSLSSTANRVGQSPTYGKAMRQYHRAAQIKRAKDVAVRKGIPAAAKAAGIGAATVAGGGAAYELGKGFLK